MRFGKRLSKKWTNWTKSKVQFNRF
ncbi:hypothetical protein E3D81_00445 [Sphingobacterium sp. CZ-2]|nr:hypothetical protein E3D81_00445 [Sphingobacterium sp. CZ-2]